MYNLAMLLCLVILFLLPSPFQSWRKSNKLHFTLRDKSGLRSETHGTVIYDGGSLLIGVDGHGTLWDDKDCCAMFERWKEDIRFVVWDDINREDPRVISLYSARTDKRKDYDN